MLTAMTSDGSTTPWTDTPADVAAAHVVWNSMSALQRELWLELILRSPETVDTAELALTHGLTTPERVYSDPWAVRGDVAGVLLAATRHFRSVGRPVPLRSCEPLPGSRALYVDAESAAPWRRMIGTDSSTD